MKKGLMLLSLLVASVAGAAQALKEDSVAAVMAPLGELQGRPLGLSLIAGPGRDHTLLDLAATMAPT